MWKSELTGRVGSLYGLAHVAKLSAAKQVAKRELAVRMTTILNNYRKKTP
jgi:hypothetical protein